jgi:hypothetical protein
MMTFAMSALHAWSAGTRLRNTPPEELRAWLEDRTELIDQAVRDILDVMPTEPELCFQLLDWAKAITTRHLVIRRLMEREQFQPSAIILLGMEEESIKEWMDDHPSTALCSFYMSRTGEVLLVSASNLSSNGAVRYVALDLITESEAPGFLADLEAYVSTVQDSQPDFELQDILLQRLGTRFFPLFGLIGIPRQLILIPHRLLHLLPLHGMKVDHDGVRIDLNGSIHSISYRATFSSLVSSFPPKGSGTKIGFAYLDPSLPATALERLHYESLRGLGLDTTVVDDPVDIPADLRDYRAIQWGAHASSNPIGWARSYLDLGDRRLEASTIAQSWRLDSCVFAVLAACESGVDLTLTSKIDEMCGIDVAFCIAGARRVYSTLWQVDDLLAAFVQTTLPRLIIGGEGYSQAITHLAQSFRLSYWQDLVLNEAEIATWPEKSRPHLTKLRGNWLSLDRDAFADPQHYNCFRCLEA